MTEENLVFVPFDEAAIAPGGIIEHLKNRWWLCCPDRGVAFYQPLGKGPRYPQCNTDEKTTRKLFERRYPNLEVRLIPSVFQRVNVSDYA